MGGFFIPSPRTRIELKMNHGQWSDTRMEQNEQMAAEGVISNRQTTQRMEIQRKHKMKY